MSLKTDIEAETREIFRATWTVRRSDRVPAPEQLGLGNDAATLDACVLYADMRDSTGLVDTHGPQFAAEIYKTFLLCAGRLIRSEEGVVTAYDGDRIMAVYIGAAKVDAAVRTAFKLNWAVPNVVNEIQKATYPRSPYAVRHIVGIDASELLVARTGFRGSNDLVWVGPAANRAAKLTEITQPYTTWVSAKVYAAMSAGLRTAKGASLWTQFAWSTMGDERVHASTAWWPLG